MHLTPTVSGKSDKASGIDDWEVMLLEENEYLRGSLATEHDTFQVWVNPSHNKS